MFGRRSQNKDPLGLNKSRQTRIDTNNSLTGGASNPITGPGAAYSYQTGPQPALSN